MLGIFTLPASVVEPVIALSISFVAIENIFSDKMHPPRWAIVFGFGLIHGMGFAGALTSFRLPEGRFLSALLGFNAGVELGQLTVLLIAAALTVKFWNKPWYRNKISIPCSIIIACIGLYWAIERAFL